MGPSDGSAGAGAPGAAPGRRRAAGLLLAVAAVCAIALTRKPHVYEFAHFWMTAKYFPELRYDGLYGDLGGALEERFGRAWVLARAPRMRDLASGVVLPAPEVLDAARARRSHWAPARWSAFVADAAALKEAMERYAPERADGLWREVFLDHGVNYPPAWVAWTHLLADRAPLTPATLRAFAFVDALFLAFAVLAAASVCGPAGALVALVFTASAKDLLAYATWAYCKLDWLALIAAALIALKRRRFGLAGALWGGAAAVRIFPGALALLFAASWFAGRRGEQGAARDLARFGAGLAGGVLVPSLLATALLAGPAGLSAAGLWSSYFSRLGHYATEGRMMNRVGVRAIAEAAGTGTFGAVAGIAAAGLALLLLAALARGRRPPERTAALALLFAPLLFAVNHFYYLLLLLPLAARERGLRWLFWSLLAVNAGVIAASVAGAPHALVLQAECLAYSLALAAAPAALFFLGRGDSARMAPATGTEKPASMLCRSCYHEIPAGSEFCPRCRARQGEPAVPPLPAAGADGSALPAAAAPAPDNPWEERGGRGWIEAYGETLQRALLHPVAFFRGTSPRGGGRAALLFAAITVSLSLGIAALWGRALDTQFGWVVNGMHVEERLPGLRHWLVGLPLLTVAAVVSVAAFCHVGLALVGAARGGFTATLKAVAYASAGLAFAAVPFLGPVVGVFWGGVLQVIGLAELHHASRRRVAFGCALPLFLLFAMAMAASLLAAFGLIRAWDLLGGGIDV